MKRFLPLLLLALMLATLTRSVVAQDATPQAGDSLLASLGYPTIAYTSDGKTLSGPSELASGRYLMTAESSADVNDYEFSFFRPAEGQTADELMADIAALDPAAEDAPEWFFSIGQAGGVSSPAQQGLVQLTAGDWVVTALYYGEGATAAVTQKVIVTGELPEYPAIEGAVDVTLADLSIDMPDTVAAGPQIWQVTNTGAIPHFVGVMNPGGEITTDDAINGVKLFYGMADATPAAEGSAQDPMTWQDVAFSANVTNGMTTFLELDLAPGTYAVFCFIEGPGELGSHALHGMTKVITVE